MPFSLDTSSDLILLVRGFLLANRRQKATIKVVEETSTRQLMFKIQKLDTNMAAPLGLDRLGRQGDSLLSFSLVLFSVFWLRSLRSPRFEIDFKQSVLFFEVVLGTITN